MSACGAGFRAGYRGVQKQGARYALTAALGLSCLAPFAGGETAAALPTAGECRFIAPDREFVADELTDPTTGATERRIALVIGNRGYSSAIGALATPISDAVAVADLLGRFGFAVHLATDATADQIRACSDQLVAGSGNYAVGLLYYSGHGIQVGDDNYLVAVDATPESVRSGSGLVAVQSIVDRLATISTASLVVLDACRTNPLAAGGRQGLSVRTGRGLGRVDAVAGSGESEARRHARGLLVAYSTSPNAVASDGTGEHSPFTAAFLRHAASPGIPIQQALSDVANGVGEATSWEQTPWTRSSLTAALRLNGRQTLEEVLSTSENWAARSASLLARGMRREAIVAALKGLPSSFQDEHSERFAAAHLALYSAIRAGHVRLPIAGTDSMTDRLYVSPDRRRVVFFSDFFPGRARPVELWDAERGIKLATPVPDLGGIYKTAFAYDRSGRRFAVGSVDGTVTIVDAEKGAVLSRAKAFRAGTTYFLESIAFSRDGNDVAMSAREFGKWSELKIWSIPQQRFIASLDGSTFDRYVGPGTRGSDVFSVSYTDSARLCVGLKRDRGGRSDAVLLIGTLGLPGMDFRPIGRLDNVDRDLTSVMTCSPDGLAAAALVVAEGAGTGAKYRLAIWSRASGIERPRQIDLDASRVVHFPIPVFSPRSSLLAVVSYKPTEIIDVETGVPAGRTEVPRGYSDEYWSIFSSRQNSAYVAKDFTLDEARIWPNVPRGRLLIRDALAELSDGERGEIKRDQVRWRPVDPATR